MMNICSRYCALSINLSNDTVRARSKSALQRYPTLHRVYDADKYFQLVDDEQQRPTCIYIHEQFEINLQ